MGCYLYMDEGCFFVVVDFAAASTLTNVLTNWTLPTELFGGVGEGGVKRAIRDDDGSDIEVAIMMIVTFIFCCSL